MSKGLKTDEKDGKTLSKRFWKIQMEVKLLFLTFMQ
jgi:hypothetical protein